MTRYAILTKDNCGIPSGAVVELTDHQHTASGFDVWRFDHPDLKEGRSNLVWVSDTVNEKETFSAVYCDPPQKDDDQVNHPSHYTQSSIEVIDVIEAFDLDRDAYRKDAVKYILRAPHKGNPRQDIQKAIWYLERWLTRNPEEDA